MDLRIALNAIKSIGLGTGARVSRYSLLKMLQDRNYKDPRFQAPFNSPGSQKAIQSISSGVDIEYEYATLTIKFLTDDMVRVTWKPGLSPIPYSIAQQEWDPVGVELISSASATTVRSKELQIEINNLGGVAFYDSSGALLRIDHPPQNNRVAWRAATRFRLDEHLSGMGERAVPFNLMGQELLSWNTDPGGSYGSDKDPIYICTPVYIAIGSTGSYLIFYENSFPAIFNFSQDSEIEFLGGELRYYFIMGQPHRLLDRYTQLTGRPLLSPRWAFGYHQSRWGYHTEEDIRRIADGFAKNQLPLSAIHLDIDYMDGFRLFTVDKSRFPDLRKLSDDLKVKGINLVAIIDPGVKKDRDYPIYQSGIENDVFCKTPSKRVLHGVVWPGWSAYPDFTNPAARLWWGEQYKFMFDANIAGFWHDMNEPVSFVTSGDASLPKSTLHDLDGRRGNHLEAHNLYGLLMNRAAFETIRKIRTGQRPWMISRSGWAGLQRYAWNWTGDVASTWEALRQTVVILLGLGMSGHLFSGADIGGFSGNPSAELYLRWFQVSTFFPFFRTHSAVGTKPREPWSFGEPYTSIIRKFLKLRYKLIPYFYTLAREANLYGSPPVRPMFWHYPEWRPGWDISDQFTLGRDILVAPILDECSGREVILPPGDWFDFWEDEYFYGSQTISSRVNQERIPVFIRGGSILPMEIQGRLELHIYPDANLSGSGSIFSDAGDGYGDWRIDKFEFTGSEKKIDLSWSLTGEYPFEYVDCLLVLHAHRIKNATIDGEFCQVSGNTIVTRIFKHATIHLQE